MHIRFSSLGTDVPDKRSEGYPVRVSYNPVKLHDRTLIKAVPSDRDGEDRSGVVL